MLDKPTDALLIVLGQKYLAQLKIQARKLQSLQVTRSYNYSYAHSRIVIRAYG